LKLGLRDRVLNRMGLTQVPAADLMGLATLYRAWCRNVPFDNVQKMIAIFEQREGLLPGTGAEEFFENWLRWGTGGTCWPTSNGLYELCRAVGFDAYRIPARMRDMEMVNHGSVVVRLQDRRWLVDTSLLTHEPLPLEESVFVQPDPVFGAEVEPVEQEHIVWQQLPHNGYSMPCRMLSREIDHAFCSAAYERSRNGSPFNTRLYARFNLPGELVIVMGGAQFTRRAEGVEKRELSEQQTCETLQAFGMNPEIVRRWVECGALASAMAPPSGPPPPVELRKPPSQRSVTAGSLRA
jgi:N-hydroxyarylamine O-acetyltransferase